MMRKWQVGDLFRYKGSPYVFEIIKIRQRPKSIIANIYGMIASLPFFVFEMENNASLLSDEEIMQIRMEQ